MRPQVSGAAAPPAQVVWFYLLIRSTLRVSLGPWLRWRVEGVERVPAAGPVVLCANHISWLDPLVVGAASPRPVLFMAKDELFHYPVLARVLPWVGAFPVRRGVPDRRAITTAVRALAAGRVVGVFPEGHRQESLRLGEMRRGAALLAALAHAPMVPVLVRGTTSRRGPAVVTFGSPLPVFTDAEAGRDALTTALTDLARS